MFVYFKHSLYVRILRKHFSYWWGARCSNENGHDDFTRLRGFSPKRQLEMQKEVGAKLIVLQLNTPGGMLNTTQHMIQKIFSSPIPIVVYVAPTGATATSAGVFLTLAGHIAAMAPGTTIGAAHPVAGDGKDIEGDMRAKAENSTIAMVKAISEQRGRNIKWAEKSRKR